MSKTRSENTTIKKVTEIVEPIAGELGLDLWDIRFLKEGPNWYLRVFIDKDGGVSIEDCENMSKAIDTPLDEADPIPQSYCLEVCSPGIERELITESHFNRFIGNMIAIRLIRPDVSGRKEIQAELIDFKDETVYVKNDSGDKYGIPIRDTAYVRLSL